jgi:hypothetical protein
VWLWLRSSGNSSSSSDSSGSSGSSLGDAWDNLLQGINIAEGNGPNNISTRNNNPGNLVAGPNQVGTSGGFAVFSDIGDGWDALTAWVQKWVSANPNGDFYDLASTYTPDGHSDQWAENVAAYLGTTPTQPVSQFLGS